MGANSFLSEKTPFPKRFVCRKANRMLQQLSPLQNKKSAESDVAPAGIVIQVPICTEKNLFCSIQETDGLEKRTK